MKLSHLIAATLLVSSPLSAADYTLGDLTVSDPYSYATAPNAMVGAGYFTITNAGSADDRLIAVRADYDKVELHNVIVDDKGVAKMIEQEGGIAVPAGATVELKRGGLHTMFIGLRGDQFEVGEMIPATLVFETAGEVDVEFMVQERTGGAMMHHGHQKMNHGDHKMGGTDDCPTGGHTMDHSKMDHSKMTHDTPACPDMKTGG